MMWWCGLCVFSSVSGVSVFSVLSLWSLVSQWSQGLRSLWCGGLISVVVWWWVLLITGLNNSCGVLWGQCFWVLCGRGGNGVTGIRVRWEMGNMGNKEMVNL